MLICIHGVPDLYVGIEVHQEPLLLSHHNGRPCILLTWNRSSELASVVQQSLPQLMAANAKNNHDYYLNSNSYYRQSLSVTIYLGGPTRMSGRRW